MLKKRAAIVSTQYEKTGIGKYAEQLYLSLTEEFEEVVKVRLNYRDQRIEILKPYKQNIYLRKWPFNISYLFTWRCRNKLKGMADVYFLTDPKLGVLNVKPKIITCLDLIPFKFPRRISEIFSRKIFFWPFKKADLTICISESTKRDLMSILRLNVEKVSVWYPTLPQHYVPHGKDSCRYLLSKYFLREDTKKLLLVSSDEPRKNVESVIIILKALLDKGFSVELIKVGKPGPFSLRDKSLELAKRLGVIDTMTFLEGVPEEEMPYFYSLADVFVFPTKYEGFGYPVLEAMACGCPVVASNNSSVPEISGGSCYLFDVDDLSSFVNKISDLLHNDELANKCSKNQIDRARVFYYHKPDKILYDFLEKL